MFVRANQANQVRLMGQVKLCVVLGGSELSSSLQTHTSTQTDPNTQSAYSVRKAQQGPSDSEEMQKPLESPLHR